MRQLQDLFKSFTFSSRYRKAGIYFLISLTVMLGGIAIVQRQAIYNQFYDWELIPRPERLTELYFTEHTKLPSTYAPGQQQQVKFSVHNLEYRGTDYSYAISQQGQDGKTKHQLAQSGFTLGHDKTKSVTVPVALTDQGTRNRIVVDITYKGIAFGQDSPSRQTQSIHYWVTKGAQ